MRFVQVIDETFSSTKQEGIRIAHEKNPPAYTTFTIYQRQVLYGID
jgi:hypothetical protein